MDDVDVGPGQDFAEIPVALDPGPAASSAVLRWLCVHVADGEEPAVVILDMARGPSRRRR